MSQIKKNVVIIGGGMAGLISARYASEAGHSVTVYEQFAEIGGTWVYSDRTDVDEYGVRIHSSLYRDLQ